MAMTKDWTARARLAARLAPGGLALLAPGCLAPPPPIVVETPYGEVRADTESTAGQFAELFERLAPEVQRILPGASKRMIDVWIQDEPRVWRFHSRPESVRGFTLLASEFDARRIHLQADGQSPWYLSHELVHALIDKSWAPLPGILEEGLGDVVAVNPDFAGHIRSHRLLNASSFSGGIRIEIAYRAPLRDGADGSEGPRVSRRVLVETGERLPFEQWDEVLGASRAELHQRWPEIPEPLYGMAWFLVDRIVERRGLDGLHELCLRATAEQHALVPRDWLYAAAGLDPQGFDPDFLAACFGRRDFLRAVYLEPEAFGVAALEVLDPLRAELGSKSLFYTARPTFVLADGREIPLGLVGPVREALRRRSAAPPETAAP
jgi:hypothetical protein